MKRPSSSFSLLRFCLWGARPSLWIFLAVYAGLSAVHLHELRDCRSVGGALSIYILIMYTYLVGGLLFGKSQVIGPRTGKFSLPCAEFILSRPFQRRQVLAFFASLYLGLVLAPVLVSAAIALRYPNLPIMLHPPTQLGGMLADTFDQPADYRAEFPHSTIRAFSDGSGRELVIPNGRLLAVGWQLGVLALVAAETLLGFLSRPGLRWRIIDLGPFTWAFFLVTLAAQFRLTNAVPDQIFYFFCHHWPWFALGVAAYAAWAWCLIERDGAEMEL